jgi:hypothetical protein
VKIFGTGWIDGAAPSRLRRRLAAAVAVVPLTAGVVALSVVAPHGSVRHAAAPPAPSPPEGQTIACAAPVGNPHCGSYLADLARRAPVPAIRLGEADKLRERIDSVMPPRREGPCEYTGDSGDACTVDISPPTAGQVRAALEKAGYPAAVIRTARPDDPAPAGSLLLAVPAGAECVLLFDDGDYSQSWTAGRLPGGECLAP